MQLSYAQRLEDYHLDLAFSGRAHGFYIDVGAGHPVADNVSYWFYLKGWRGLVVEPQRSLLDIYAHLRPRDAAVGTLVGSRNGEADFHLVERLHGFSTTRADHARAASGFGVGVETVRMPMRTLASLVEEHGVKAVDFLKIDVEGAEADVLAGADWQKCRPLVILIEAVSPGTMTQSWSEWEPLLLAHGYRFRLFDGLNRFYVAEEAADIAERLPGEPAPWDSAAHLYDFGRPLDQPGHPDHALARDLAHGLLAALPSLDPAFLADLLLRRPARSGAGGANAADEAARLLFGAAELPGELPPPPPGITRAGAYRQLMATDRFRAALGRIAAAYDGGHIMD